MVEEKLKCGLRCYPRKLEAMRTFYFRGFGKLVSLLPNQSASFILALEELGNITKIPQVVKILTIVPLLIETGYRSLTMWPVKEK